MWGKVQRVYLIGLEITVAFSIVPSVAKFGRPRKLSLHYRDVARSADLAAAHRVTV
jgi:hypothetical protein